MPHRSLRDRSDRPFLDIGTHGRRGSASQQGRLLAAQIEQIARTVRSTPEVMQFASHLRAQGIAANATERAVRGVTDPRKLDGIYRAMLAGRSTHMRARAESVDAALRAGNMQIEPGKVRILDTRRNVVQGWLAVRETLRMEGRDGLADEVGRFVAAMPPPRTEREWLAQALTERIRRPERQQPTAQTR